MSELLGALVLAIVQGLTEFLPVSSSGHLVVARMAFGISDVSGTAFDAFLHLGTLLAVLVFYWRVWWGIGRGLVRRDAEAKDKRVLLAKLLLATIPAAIVGYAARELFDGALRTPSVVGVGFLVTAAVLWLADRYAGRGRTIARAGYGDAVFIGLAQVLALVPGVSRSGMTMAAGRQRGLSRQQAVTFSFLLSAPIIAGAGLSSLPLLLAARAFDPAVLLVGLVVSFGSGLLAIYGLSRFVERLAFTPLVIYLVGLAAVVLYVG